MTSNRSQSRPPPRSRFFDDEISRILTDTARNVYGTEQGEVKHEESSKASSSVAGPSTVAAPSTVEAASSRPSAAAAAAPQSRPASPARPIRPIRAVTTPKREPVDRPAVSPSSSVPDLSAACAALREMDPVFAEVAVIANLDAKAQRVRASAD